MPVPIVKYGPNLARVVAAASAGTGAFRFARSLYKQYAAIRDLHRYYPRGTKSSALRHFYRSGPPSVIRRYRPRHATRFRSRSLTLYKRRRYRASRRARRYLRRVRFGKSFRKHRRLGRSRYGRLARKVRSRNRRRRGRR